MGRLRAALAMLVLLASLAARAEAPPEPQRLFTDGRQAFEQGDYQRAYDLFKRSFMRSSEPALLFNMASAQQKLGRPHDAADSLRAYLRAAPEDGERPQIEQRIRALEEQQHLLDAERKPEQDRAAPT